MNSNENSSTVGVTTTWGPTLEGCSLPKIENHFRKGNTWTVLPETQIPEKSEFSQGFHARRRKKLKSGVDQGRNLFLGRGFRWFSQFPESSTGKMGAGPGLLSAEGEDIFPPDQDFFGRLSYTPLSLYLCPGVKSHDSSRGPARSQVAHTNL